MKGHLYIIGCGVSSGNFPPEGREILLQADVIAGGKRLLETHAPENIERIVLDAGTRKTSGILAERSRYEKVMVLASGDALFHGIAGTFSRIMPPGSYTVVPNITSFQYFFARLGIPWSETRLFSIHGNKPLRWREILGCESAVIYCDYSRNFAKVAAELIEKWPDAASRRAAAGICLGSDTEKIISGSLAELAENTTEGISMLAVFPAGNTSFPPLLLGFDDNHYAHENNLITHPEIRAVALSKLRLRGGVMWDIGAGSGSVGIEAAGLCAELSVFAVEKVPARLEHIRGNISAEGLGNVSAVEGEAPECFAKLPGPDMIFIGGGGKDIGAIAKAAFAKLKSGGRMVVTAVTLETMSVLAETLPEVRHEVVTINVSRSRELSCSTLMKAENPITIFVFMKENSECQSK